METKKVFMILCIFLIIFISVGSAVAAGTSFINNNLVNHAANLTEINNSTYIPTHDVINNLTTEQNSYYCLDNSLSTVNLLQSSINTKRDDFISSWSNLCTYSTLLINNKSVFQGETTDPMLLGADNRDNYSLNNQSTINEVSVHNDTDSNSSVNSTNSPVSIADILDAAVRTKAFIETNHELPKYITLLVNNTLVLMRYTCF